MLVFRGTPLIVQIFFVYFGVNLLFGFTLIPTTSTSALFALDGAVFAGILALGLNEGAYMREIIRAGIDAIDKGQMEAARSLGMTYGLAMRRIVLPQAARVIVPPLGNEFNAMLKNTSLVFSIGVYEMFSDAEIHYSTTFKPVEFFGAVAFWYLVLTTRLEADPGADRAQARRQRARRRAVASGAPARGLGAGAGLGARSTLTRSGRPRASTSTSASAGSRC